MRCWSVRNVVQAMPYKVCLVLGCVARMFVLHHTGFCGATTHSMVLLFTISFVFVFFWTLQQSSCYLVEKYLQWTLLWSNVIVEHIQKPARVHLLKILCPPNGNGCKFQLGNLTFYVCSVSMESKVHSSGTVELLVYSKTILKILI